MVEELKALIDAVADVPMYAMGGIGIYFAYKLLLAGAIVGSILKGWLALIGVAKDHIAQKIRAGEQKLEIEKHVKNRMDTKWLDGICITGCEQQIIDEIKRLRKKRNDKTGLSYIHSSDVDWLREAIDEKFEREATKN